MPGFGGSPRRWPCAGSSHIPGHLVHPDIAGAPKSGCHLVALNDGHAKRFEHLAPFTHYAGDTVAVMLANTPPMLEAHYGIPMLGAVLNALRVRKGASVAVIGAGAVGLSAVMAAGIAEAATIVALDINPVRVDLARMLGATHAFLATDGTMADHAAKAGCPAGFDYIIDTTGIADLCNAAISALAPRGELALVGAYAPGMSVSADATLIMSGGRVVRGVVEGSADPASFIPQLIAYYRAGRFPFDRLVQYFDFADIAAAIEAGESGRVIKPILRLP